MRLRSRKGPPAPLLLGLGALLGLLLVAFLGSPRVIAFSPSGESLHVSSLTPISLRFNQPMDRGSVEARLSVEPRIAGQLLWQEDRLTFVPLEPWPAGEEITVRLAAGSRSTRLLPLLWEMRWAFRIGPPRLSYLWPAGGTTQLYAWSPAGGAPERLTSSELGVVDFAVSPRGNWVVYSELRSDGGTDLRRLDLTSGDDALLLSCPADTRCHDLAVAPDASRIAFVQTRWEATPGGSDIPGADSIWTLALGDGASPQRMSDPDHAVESPLWSPTALLAFYDASLQAVAVVDPEQGPESPPVNLIPNGLGLLGSWTVDGAHLLLPDILIPLEDGREDSTGGAGSKPEFFSHIFQVQVLTGAEVDLSGEQAGYVEDASPVPSPDGQWIAFARKYLDSRWSPGRQLWLMRPDGSQATELTRDPDYHHSAFAWSPDARLLAYMRFNQTTMAQPAEIWVLDLSNNRAERIAEGGYLPRWIP